VGLSQAHRLQDRRDFQLVYQKGSRHRSPHLTLRALSNSSDLIEIPTRLGISISQKVSKKAVIRNRIKRQLKGAFRELLPQIASGWKLVIVVSPEASQCEYEHFLRELKQLLIKAEVINGY
jgi:ribonuclease P protein component